MVFHLMSPWMIQAISWLIPILTEDRGHPSVAMNNSG